ncbi:hypothetical protein [Gymnodinialimonas hymeniacidonis]|uniref:hypothetical protein n=1 Tax=Gymnodinialimonas hymeniacidonis TaxID=3126508 RepID=UPI0034C65BF2
MSTMNILSITLIVLILASGIALFFGIRAAQANEPIAPVLLPVPSVEANFAPDTMDEVSSFVEVQ